MAFYEHMKRHLNPPLEVSEDSEWYIGATTDALNEWMIELENALAVPCLSVNGSCVTPAGVSSPYNVMNVGYFVPRGVRFQKTDVKNAMWCDDPALSFPNLFDLVGRKIGENFSKVVATPALIGGQGLVKAATTHFTVAGSALISWARAICTPMAKDPSTSSITPESFLRQESDLLLNAVRTIPPIPVTVVGDPVPATPVLCPGGIFIGTIGVNFANAR